MVQYVWEAAMGSGVFESVLVATDDDSVSLVVHSFGATAVMTPSELPSGTDRVAMVAREHSAPIVVNLQSDEPMLSTKAIRELVRTLVETPEADMATLAVEKQSVRELADPNVVKVVWGADRCALYFSRQPLTNGRDGSFYKHIGIYAFRRDALFRFCELPVSPLEKAERLEQLRALENGMKIAVCLVDSDTIAVDTPGDIARVERAWLDDSLRKQEELE